MTDEAAVRALHERPERGVFAVSGGGALLLSDLMTVPGASGTVVYAAVPYARAALAAFIGAEPDAACSPATARDLAMRCFLQAGALDPGPDRFGFAITASLATNRPKAGAHRAHLAMQTPSDTRTWSLHLAKGARSRAEEERALADVALHVLTDSCGVTAAMPALMDTETLAADIAAGDAAWQALLAGERQVVGDEGPRALFPGAFHPLHDGHRRMAQLAAKRLGVPVVHEISIHNVDKPPLNFHDMRERAAQFEANGLCFTNTATFVEKARVFGGVTFVVGADTMRRIADPQYYPDGNMSGALAEIADRDCRFLVFGRSDGDRFVTLDDLDLPQNLRARCDGVTEADYRRDLSSTELRGRSRRSTQV